MSQNNVAAAEVSVTRRRPRGGTLICLMGIDGAGKSTQAAALAESLQEQDVDAVYAWARWKPILMSPARPRGQALVRRKRIASDDCQGWTASKRASPRGRLWADLWKHLVLLEHSWQAFTEVRVPMLMGKAVVADCYVYDTLIDLSLNLNRPPDELLKEPLLRLFPTPDLSILLDLSPKVGAARKRDGTAEETLAERRDLYLCLAGALGVEEVDAELSPTEVQAEIRRRVWKRLGF